MIYLNNAATSFPKFNIVNSSVYESLSNGFMFCNRDSIEYFKISETIFKLRKSISDFINANEAHHICFTASDTLALNMLIFGQKYKKNSVVLTSTREHNSVARPLFQLSKQQQVKIEYIPFNENNDLNLDILKQVIQKNKGNIVCGIFSHANNVTGDLIDVVSLGKILKKNNIKFILDTAQTIGIVPIDVEKMNISALTFSGHKGLNGPQGTGGFYIRDNFKIIPIMYGGTGNSSSTINPDIVYPDSFEVGTPAIHDLIGLYSAILHINNKIGKETYSKAIINKTQYLYNELIKIPNIILYGNKIKKTPIISFNIKNFQSSDIGKYLGKHSIVCRTGYHCSALGIYDIDKEKEFYGTVRLSCGYFTSINEINYVVNVLKKLQHNA